MPLHVRALPPCQLAPVPPRGFAVLTFALLHAAPPQLHLCTSEPGDFRRRAQINPASSAMVSNLCSRRSILTCRSVTFLDSSAFWATSCWRRARICSLEVLLFTWVMHGCVRSSHSDAGTQAKERRGFIPGGKGSGPMADFFKRENSPGSA